MAEQQSKAQTLLEQGKLAFKNNQYETSVNLLGEACQLLYVISSKKIKINPVL